MANRKRTAWLSEIFFFSSLLLILIDCVVMIFLFASPNSLVRCVVLWCILCPASYIPSPLTSLAEALWWPWELLPLWHARGQGIPTVTSMPYSPALTPQRSSRASFHNCFQLLADVRWVKLGSMKRRWKPKSHAVTSTSSCSPWNQTVSLGPLWFDTVFTLCPVLLHPHPFQHRQSSLWVEVIMPSHTFYFWTWISSVYSIVTRKLFVSITFWAWTCIHSSGQHEKIPLSKRNISVIFETKSH